ncbi:hypothetical protein ABQE22_14030 [Enterococcus durans]|nr:hypothetical protein [Enterococcus durans]MDB1655413.1 hypothetical protein [Enterococcus durans]MDB1673964.1 hypothetical protein [Enterococcus durans]WCG68369.1 hypothetical protein PML92_09430 [Enterococcus durans]
MDDQLENPAQNVIVKLKNLVGIKTEAHLKDGSDKFTHGDIVDT